jgi:hypothetical protein
LLLCGALQTHAQSCSYTNINCGQSIAQRLENSGCRFSNSSQPFSGFTFNAVAGQVLDIFLESDNFPPLVLIYESGNSNPLMYDDGNSIAYIRFDVPHSGTYRILAAANNSAISGLFELSVYCQTVCKAPFITSPSTAMTIAYGAQATITVGADGTPPLHYRWFDEANPTATLSTAPPPFTTAPLFATTSFGVDVSNACGTASRHFVALVNVVPCSAPTITQQPQTIRAQSGQFVALSVGASGTDLKYQWYRGERGDTSRPVPYLGTGSSSYTAVAGGTSYGRYWVRVSNACGSVDSEAALLDVETSRRRAVRK